MPNNATHGGIIYFLCYHDIKVIVDKKIAAQECAAYVWIALCRVVILDRQYPNQNAAQECAAYAWITAL